MSGLFYYYFCAMFDSLFFSVYSHYKERKNKKAVLLSIIYITLVQVALLSILVIFFSKLSRQLGTRFFTESTNIITFVFVTMLLYIINWFQYSGKSFSMKRAKYKQLKERNIFILWSLPILMLLLVIILFQAS